MSTGRLWVTTERHEMSTGRLWATRTIKRGKVCINGRYYRPQNRHMEYDGRLEGQRYIFGLYGDNEAFVSLTAAHPYHPAEPGPEIIKGRLPWLFWEVTDD